MLRSALKQSSRPSSPVPSPLILPVPQRTLSASSFATSFSHYPTLTASTTYCPSTAPTPMQSPSFQPISSPSVAAQGYTPKVSFDTFENPVASMFSYTLRVQSDGYVRNRSTRVFLCASSPDESGTEALDWALECLVQDGDELIVFRGIDQEELDKDHELVREEARELMKQVQEKCVEYDPNRKVSIIVEFIAGRPTTTLDRLIALYRPDSVVVGSRGEKRVLGFGAGRAGGVFGGFGSVSKYALSHSPVPIIVVRPESKVKKVREKRRKDPKRGTHFDELARPQTATSSTSLMPSSLTRSVTRS